MHPDVREAVAERARLRDLVLVVREDEVEPAAVDLELRSEVLLRHDRALDVPARPPASPGRVPGRVLVAASCAFQSAKSRGSSLRGVRLLLFDLVEPLRPRAARSPERRATRKYTSPPDSYAKPRSTSSLDHRDLISETVSTARRLDVRSSEAEVARVLDVPARGVARRARALASRRGVVDLVVDVGDVDDELRLVAGRLEASACSHIGRT